jgi:hypothetical protein
MKGIYFILKLDIVELEESLPVLILNFPSKFFDSDRNKKIRENIIENEPKFIYGNNIY